MLQKGKGSDVDSTLMETRKAVINEEWRVIAPPQGHKRNIELRGVYPKSVSSVSVPVKRLGSDVDGMEGHNSSPSNKRDSSVQELQRHEFLIVPGNVGNIVSPKLLSPASSGGRGVKGQALVN
ncbi:hypothetical protein RHMOL_Rhmol05G0014900 [Rhododendron molle]|uniref:Uncharacterized protein n=1 Tax=Rhododendron molle TaxID=49168 RepID=A0ACC0NKZ5_RHOML|nr:hypothetical protein RHMOL_Rhmol05G0014900 [Rhododendron molle]